MRVFSGSDGEGGVQKLIDYYLRHQHSESTVRVKVPVRELAEAGRKTSRFLSSNNSWLRSFTCVCTCAAYRRSSFAGGIFVSVGRCCCCCCCRYKALCCVVCLRQDRYKLDERIVRMEGHKARTRPLTNSGASQAAINRTR